MDSLTRSSLHSGADVQGEKEGWGLGGWDGVGSAITLQWGLSQDFEGAEAGRELGGRDGRLRGQHLEEVCIGIPSILKHLHTHRQASTGLAGTASDAPCRTTHAQPAQQLGAVASLLSPPLLCAC